MSTGSIHGGRPAAWHALRDPALWLGIGVAAPHCGMRGYFLWQIGRALGNV
jgi:hypothetical protein